MLSSWISSGGLGGGVGGGSGGSNTGTSVTLDQSVTFSIWLQRDLQPSAYTADILHTCYFSSQERH